ncbi:MAG: ABC transporter permease [Gammaproteobacteria bacterium]
MIRLILVRLASALATVAGVASIVFLLLHAVPGDPVEVMLGESARPAEREALRSALGLDRPLAEQWAGYLARSARLDFGDSLHTRTPVTDLLAARLPATAALAAAAIAIAAVIALPLGIFAAVRRGTRWDRLAIGFAVLGSALPVFLLGPVLILLFAIRLQWLPVSGAAGLAGLALPALTLGLALASGLTRMVRTAMLESLDEDCIRTARAKGLTERAVLLRHALRVAAVPIVTVLGLQIGALLAGAVITETLFSWPGLGGLLVESIHRRDYPVVQACVLAVGAAYVAVNALTDLACGAVDPRARHSR